MSSPAITEIPNFLTISATIATSGQPTVAQFAAIQAAGYQVVVNLAMSTSENWLPEEADVVQAQGMDYHHIPVHWDNPTLEDLDQLFAILAENGDRKVWVHCALNMRVSAMIYLYNRLQRGLSDEISRHYLEQIWTPNRVWKNFIEATLELYTE